jgi:hypothetical protein
MKKICSLAFAGLFAVTAAHCGADTVTETFSADPLSNGWQTFGHSSLFQWDSTNETLTVTWDSSFDNSYFYKSLGTTLTKNDDFHIEFDLRLSGFQAGVDPAMPSPFPLSIGLINLAEAEDAGFYRGTGYSSPDLVEFSFFPDPGGAWVYGPSVTGVIVDQTAFNWAYGYNGNALTTNDLYHVTLNYTAATSRLVTTVTRNGQPFIASIVAGISAGFTDFQVDTISINSYSQAGQDTNSYGGVIYAGSILAHGAIDNMAITLPPAVHGMTGASTNGLWQVRFGTYAGWVYTLERTTDFVTWTPVADPLTGAGTAAVLQDLNPPADHAFYRIKAEPPLIGD